MGGDVPVKVGGGTAELFGPPADLLAGAVDPEDDPPNLGVEVDPLEELPNLGILGVVVTAILLLVCPPTFGPVVGAADDLLTVAPLELPPNLDPDELEDDGRVDVPDEDPPKRELPVPERLPAELEE